MSDDEEGLFVPDIAAASRIKDNSYDSDYDFGLHYINEIVRSQTSSNSLAVVAKGLGLPKVAASMLHCYCAAGTRRNAPQFPPFDSENLIFVLNAHDRDLDLLTEQLAIVNSNHDLVARDLEDINAKVVAAERAKRYKRGGIYAVTSRIFTVDLICGNVDISKITSVIILNAHTVSETSKVAFIIRLIRNKNKVAHICALSDHPEGVSRGINGLPNRLKYLGVQTVSLWPRFRFEVAKCLHSRKLDEVAIEMDPRTVVIQSCLQDIIQATISQIKRNVKQMDTESWNVDAVYAGNLFLTVRIAVEPVYHKLSFEARQALRDLESLQYLLHGLSNTDAPSWYLMAEKIRLDATRGSMPSLWVTLPASDAMYQTSRERLHLNDVPGKWNVLLDLLEELKGKRTLIMCADSITAINLKLLLKYGPESYLRRLRKEVEKTLDDTKKTSKALHNDSSLPEKPVGATNDKASKPTAPPSKRRRVRGGGSPQVSSRAASKDPPSPTPLENNEDEESQDQSGDTEPVTWNARPVNRVKFKDGQPEFSDIPDYMGDDFKQHSDFPGEIVFATYKAPEILEKYRPDAVIMYEPDLQFTREIEVYEATYKKLDIIFFMYYQRSVEELQYLTKLRKEKDVFSALISEKAKMPMVLDDDDGFYRKGDGELRVVNTRIAGGQTRTQVFNETEKIIVDAREFMSDLPFLIWKQGIDIIPIQLEVGDYILTPDCVVERKSISDLLSSFKDGRLYDQCTKMFKHYKKPVLLIEFNGDQAFSFEQFRETGGYEGKTVHEKLAVIFLLFPKLKVIWSSSQRNTAEIFESLKYGQKQPSPSECAQVGRKLIVNHMALAVLRAIPGVTAASATLIADKLGCLADLADMSKDDLAAIVGKESANKITRFLDTVPKNAG